VSPNLNHGRFATLHAAPPAPPSYAAPLDPRDLLSNPDLAPPHLTRKAPPRTLPLLESGKSKKNVANILSKECYSRSAVEEFASLSPVEPAKTPAVEEAQSRTAGDIRDQIRNCLSRVRKRRITHHSTSTDASPLPDFSVGLHRLETLVTTGAASLPASDTGTRTPPRTAHAGTLTELHQSATLPEVELVSLVQEQLPAYKLRADAQAVAAEWPRVRRRAWDAAVTVSRALGWRGAVPCVAA